MNGMKWMKIFQYLDMSKQKSLIIHEKLLVLALKISFSNEENDKESDEKCNWI